MMLSIHIIKYKQTSYILEKYKNIMGCFDMYCCVCGGPFTPYPTEHYPEMKNIDTKWLADAIIEFNDGKKASVNYYDGYGRFQDSNEVEYDIVENEYNKEVKIYHRLCQGKQRTNTLKKYQQQHFNIDLLIENNKQNILDSTTSNPLMF
jgi:hypothetical protein